MGGGVGWAPRGGDSLDVGSGQDQWSGSISPGRQKLGGNLELETNGRTHGQSWLRSEPTNNYPPNINPLAGWTGRKVKPSRVKYQL